MPQVAAINAAMSSLIKTLNVFPRERTIVSRERSKKVGFPSLNISCYVILCHATPCHAVYLCTASQARLKY